MDSASDRSAPPILAEAGPLLRDYDVLFCDVWGVVHNGRKAYAEGCAALTTYRKRGGTVVLLSNAPRTAKSVARVLDGKGVPTSCWDAIVPSGDLARAYAADQDIRRIYHIGPDRDLDVFHDSGLERVSLGEAQAVFCTGLIDDRYETAEDYRLLLEPAIALALPLICANPDLVVDVGGDLLPCAGAIASVYERMGGVVCWAGKPYAIAYAAAEKMAFDQRGASVHKSRILAIGDSVRTDVAGAVNYGIDVLFIGQGIHRESIMPGGVFLEKELERLFAGQPRAISAMETLRW
ncbi:MAG: TIGR01459 family HAD-type hydrolase [Hyphomicrobiaceae bacterium]